MKMLKLLVTAAVGVGFVVAASGSAHALSLSLHAAPSAITSIGQTLLVDLNVSGVEGSDGGGTLRGYDIVIHFDPSVLSLGSSEDIVLNLAPFGGSPVVDSSVLGGNSASLTAFVSLAMATDTVLRAAQTDAFQLAQLSFISVSVPVQTTISFDTTFNDLTGRDGFSDPSSGARAHTSMDLVLMVPEPAVATLAVLGLAALIASRRRRAR